ncbi:protein-tyrosine phosphatase-like protein [Podospora fimiseda]|uniref:Protein-tyrosine phosphatase-like protein n=1 Tax=Podospora fimiseda TaxID=252190 RepID=A0AAN7BQI4_9PEZI|nr:protein-tyrosine phosphatase-like protein [Podospora fimiseda]
MAHLVPRPFQRRKKDAAAGPPLITNDLVASGTGAAGKTKPTTLSPIVGVGGDFAQQPQAPESPARQGTLQKLSPFRVFARSSAKRARDSPPASLPHSPAAVAPVKDSSVDGRPVSPLSLKATEAMSSNQDRNGVHNQHFAQDNQAQKPGRGLKPKRPAFLDLSEQDIENKFSELMWLERIRVQQGIENESSSCPQPDHRWQRVKGPHLRKLDRYMNIQPWHNHRVKLQVPEGKLDYVNASPIVLQPTSTPGGGLPREVDRYIAMQGPKQASTDHVWRMIVEQVDSPGVIVMLTETHEGHMEKCFPYFPRNKEDPPLEINEKDEFGDGFRATVRCEGMEDTPAGDAIELRKLVIKVHPPKPSRKSRNTTPDPLQLDADLDVKMKSPSIGGGNTAPPSPLSPDGSEEKVIWHFLYKKWPDFGVPAIDDLDSFFTLMQLSREKNAHPNNPRIVHCSAGVGRSGTFIALEHLMRELDAGMLENWDERVRTRPVSPEVPQDGREGGEWSREPSYDPLSDDIIFDTVNALREQRKMMVQAETQYLFIYEVLRKLWTDKYGEDEQVEEREEEEKEEDDQQGTHIGEPKKKRVEVEFEKEGGEVERKDPFV